MAESLAIAREIVEPVQGKYTEVLIYLHQHGAKSQFAGRRVQWTPTGGYKETALDAISVGPWSMVYGLWSRAAARAKTGHCSSGDGL